MLATASFKKAAKTEILEVIFLLMNNSARTFFLVSFLHRDLDLWRQYLEEHVSYLNRAVEEGTLRASGPVRIPGDSNRHGFLIFSCSSREELIASISQDPFYTHGVIDELTMVEWDPVFGIFAAESSGSV